MVEPKQFFRANVDTRENITCGLQLTARANFSGENATVRISKVLSSTLTLDTNETTRRKQDTAKCAYIMW